MSRSTPLWVGKTDDAPIPPRVKDRVFDRAEGRCAKCTRELRPGQWECDHAIPLILGGRNAEDNLQPLCAVPCHKRKTAADIKIKAKVARVRKRHLGITQPGQKIRSRGFEKSSPQRRASSPVNKWRGF